MMGRLRTNFKWLDDLLPEGILVPSSTLICGPGGTGKPLVEFAFVDAWLRAGRPSRLKSGRSNQLIYLSSFD